MNTHETSYYTQSAVPATYIDEQVVATQKRRAIDTLRANKQAAIDAAQQQYETAKAQLDMETQARFEMAKAAIESRRMQEIMNLEQLNAHDRMELEQAVQTQRMNVESQALALEQQARQQALAKSQYENFMKFNQQNNFNNSFAALSPRPMPSYGNVYHVPSSIATSHANLPAATPIVSSKVIRPVFANNENNHTFSLSHNA